MARRGCAADANSNATANVTLYNSRMLCFNLLSLSLYPLPCFVLLDFSPLHIVLHPGFFSRSGFFAPRSTFLPLRSICGFLSHSHSLLPPSLFFVSFYARERVRWRAYTHTHAILARDLMPPELCSLFMHRTCIHA